MMALQRILAFLMVITAIVSAQDCVWNKDTDYPTYPPLFIDKSSWISIKAKMEGTNRIVRISNGQSVVLACSKTLITTLGTEVAEGFCAGGSNLNIGGKLYTMANLGCTKRIGDSALPLGSTCGNMNIGILADLGFTVPGYQFYPTIRVCFKSDIQITIYAEDVVYGESVKASDGNPSKPAFKDDNYFYPTINPNDCYLTASQTILFTDLVGDPNFIDLNSGKYYFARGHLAPNADFLIEMEADSSYYYINAIPQWQAYNGGNWMYLESNVRDLAAKYTYNLTTWTGPWDSFIINDVNNNPTTVNLCSSQNQEIIPIPESIWKVVYEPISNTAVAVITSNHAYQVTAPTPVCKDIGCLTLGWITFDISSLDKGFTYCCTVQDFYSVNKNAPNLPTAGVLFDPPKF